MENHDYGEETMQRQLNPGEIAERLRDIFYPGRSMNSKVLHEVEELIEEIDPKEPEIKRWRLVHGELNGHDIYGKLYGGVQNDKTIPVIITQGGTYSQAYNIEPVHRRCNELTSEQIDRWVDVWEDDKNYDALDALKVAYEIITGEDHP